MSKVYNTLELILKSGTYCNKINTFLYIKYNWLDNIIKLPIALAIQKRKTPKNNTKMQKLGKEKPILLNDLT